MTALIAVLKWKRSTSSVTFFTVRCVRLRSSSHGPAAPGGVRGGPGADLLGRASTRRQIRLRKRWQPSIPSSLHSRSFSGGAAKSENRRVVSAP